MSTYLNIELGQESSCCLTFRIEQSPIARLWTERMLERTQWPLDDPKRFYGFNSPQQEEERAKSALLECIQLINDYDYIIQRRFTSVFDQDFLNYLHHVFEVYHGLLDQQDHDWFLSAPGHVQQALGNLNVAVHRCESLRHNKPRFVCTWFGQPKEKTLPDNLMLEHGTLNIEFGGVYLNYVEIGKTLFELATDNDNYIAANAFKPFKHYSSDFVAYFYDTNTLELSKDLNLIDRYYRQHREFFQSQGLDNINSVKARPLKFKVAQLDYTDRNLVLDKIRHNQFVSKVTLE